MSGIILLLILAIWLFVVIKLTGLVTSNMKTGNKKNIIYWILFVLFLIVPVADDIAGGFQFRAMCSLDNMLVYDAEKLRGKSVVPRNVPMQTINKILPISVSTGQWEDIETGELLVTYKIYRAKGGWLSRFIGFPEGSPPYTFDGYCSPVEYYQLFKKLDVKKIEH